MLFDCNIPVTATFVAWSIIISVAFILPNIHDAIYDQAKIPTKSRTKRSQSSEVMYCILSARRLRQTRGVFVRI